MRYVLRPRYDRNEPCARRRENAVDLPFHDYLQSVQAQQNAERTAATLLVVNWLARPKYRIEVEAVAAKN
jgi:enamine deaminase RidA (YjgF/YER057c/UK114 family)